MWRCVPFIASDEILPKKPAFGHLALIGSERCLVTVMRRIMANSKAWLKWCSNLQVKLPNGSEEKVTAEVGIVMSLHCKLHAVRMSYVFNFLV